MDRFRVSVPDCDDNHWKWIVGLDFFFSSDLSLVTPFYFSPSQSRRC